MVSLGSFAETYFRLEGLFVLIVGVKIFYLTGLITDISGIVDDSSVTHGALLQVGVTFCMAGLGDFLLYRENQSKSERYARRYWNVGRIIADTVVCVANLRFCHDGNRNPLVTAFATVFWFNVAFRSYLAYAGPSANAPKIKASGEWSDFFQKANFLEAVMSVTSGVVFIAKPSIYVRDLFQLSGGNDATLEWSFQIFGAIVLGCGIMQFSADLTRPMYIWWLVLDVLWIGAFAWWIPASGAWNLWSISALVSDIILAFIRIYYLIGIGVIRLEDITFHGLVNTPSSSSTSSKSARPEPIQTSKRTAVRNDSDDDDDELISPPSGSPPPSSPDLSSPSPAPSPSPPARRTRASARLSNRSRSRI